MSDRGSDRFAEDVEGPTSLYVHVPFCSSRCSYCDFLSSVPARGDEHAVEAVIAGILERVEGLARRFGVDDFHSLYIGGGTPSVLPRPLLRRLLEGLGPRAGRAVEWTVEANPESLDEEFLDILEGEGVTRLSLGIQSLDDSLLGELGRGAKSATALAALTRAARRRLRVSADLIAGMARRDGLAAEARALVETGVGHISIYDLSLEEGTVLEKRWRNGDFVLQDEDAVAEDRGAAEEVLAAKGFSRYEVSNYALPGMESAHNLVYWRMGSWLGAGPGASGTLALRPAVAESSHDAASWSSRGAGPWPARPGIDGASLRIEETRSLSVYAAGGASAVAKESRVAPADAAFETMMMGFRTAEGLDTGAFERRFGAKAEDLIGRTLDSWAPRLRRLPGRLSLDARGLDLLNRFLSDCLEELGPLFPRP